MQRRHPFIILALLVALALTGCSDFRSVQREELPSSETTLLAEHTELYREVAAAVPIIHSLDGYADVWVKTPSEQHKVFCNIRLQRGGASRMVVSAGFIGLPVADVFLTRDSLYVHDMLRNRLYVGSNSAASLEKMLNIKSSYQLLSESLLGLVTLHEPPSAVTAVKQGGGMLLLTVKSNDSEKEVVIDPIARTLNGMMFKEPNSDAVTEVRFRNFEAVMVEGQRALVPKEIEVARYSGVPNSTPTHTLVIAYDERRFNTLQQPLRYTPPKKAKVLVIKG
uniref:DUF4292 domain-containing protein n=1 Tax=Chlorobium chlorochromatii (strain CaD3) TaxID=340177 RepID=Q3ASF9_CHLCH